MNLLSVYMKKLLTLALIFAHLILFAQRPLPELWGVHVHDEANTLSPAVIDRLEHQLKVYEDSTSNQIAILIIPSLAGEVLEEYSLKVSEKWKLGQGKKDNGVLLLIAVDDHKMRIETGSGLEGVLTDAICNRIIRNEIAPNFRKNEYDAGVQAGVDAIIKAIGGEYAADESDSSGSELGLTEKIILGVIIFGMLGIFTVIGLIVPGGAGWFVYAFLIPFYASFPLIAIGVKEGLIGLGIYLVLFPILKLLFPKTSLGKKMARKFEGTGSRSKRGGGNTPSSGWSSGGSSWSSSGSSGSFSGGGGSSGSW
jgi:uncharacterized protein